LIEALKRLAEELQTFDEERTTAVQWVQTERFSLKL
jgi:hypothetical protein